LSNYNFQLPIIEDPIPALLARTDFAQAIVFGQLNQGFRLREARLVFVTFDEIFGTRKRQPVGSAKLHPSHFLTSLSELKQDDFVVHLDHGIGVYRGLKFLTVAGVAGEFLHLEYQGGDRLYLPVDRINMVQKYIGGDGAAPGLFHPERPAPEGPAAGSGRLWRSGRRQGRIHGRHPRHCRRR